MSLSVSADGISSEIITPISGINNLMVSAALSDYFAERENFLLGITDTISTALSGILNDEDAHKEWYASRNIALLDTSYTIDTVSLSDNRAEVLVTECVTYSLNETTSSSDVTHIIWLALNSNNEIIVTADGYFEDFSGFRSCSYVSETATQTSSTGGSSNCIIHVAEGEVGTQETGNNMTKYGEWYGLNGVGWCGMFVAWCAEKANIATSIIPKNGSPEGIMSFLQNQNRFYYSSTFGGTTAPQAGDLFFLTENNASASHVGIIRYVDSTHIYVVHGNWSNQVKYDTFSRTRSDILGYGRPAYSKLSHSFSYQFSAARHWTECVNCGYEYSSEAHSFTYQSDDSQHWRYCATCTYQGTKTEHSPAINYSTNSTTHWRYCTVCLHKVENESHQFGVFYNHDETHHWYDCLTCSYDKNKTSHTFVQSGIGEPYVCSGCDYTTYILPVGALTIGALECCSE